VVLQVAALPILYVVSNITCRGVLYAQPVVLASYSYVTHATWGRVTKFPRSFISFSFTIYDDVWKGRVVVVFELQVSDISGISSLNDSLTVTVV
jgi:hypothetical protein